MKKQLQHIVPDYATLHGAESADDLIVEGLTLDSRHIPVNGLYAALKGTQVDGHTFIENAIEGGAKAILCENLPAKLQKGIAYIQVADTAQALGEMAAAFYNHPSRQVKTIAITGTNGKTTTATIVKNALQFLGYKTGLLSTVQIEIGDDIFPTTHTTPNAIAMQAHLQQMAQARCQFVVMEASSHAIHQKRIAGTQFHTAVFTNISHDHLDYHKTFANYIKAKKALFDQLPSSAYAISNVDDKNGEIMLQNCKARKLRYSLKKLADFKGRILSQDFTGMQLKINELEFHAKLSGTFNAYNLTAAYGILSSLGFESTEICMALSQADGAAGRLEWTKSQNGTVGIVDYAHTPDALENVLSTIQDMNAQKSQIITVVGCGGNRDAGKRPEMAKIAAELSDKVILTSDNPRNEDPAAIVADMEEGIPLHKRMNALTILDRRNAIKTACQLAQAGDVILIAGKGHEKYQIIGDEKRPFDDKAILQEFLKHDQ